MTYEAEMEQIVSTALTLQDDYIKFTPKNQNMACHAEIIGIFHDIHPTVEIKEPHQDKSVLQETLVELYSVLGIPQEPQVSKTMKFEEPEQHKESSSTVTRSDPLVNSLQSTGLKRPFCEDEHRELKKPLIQAEDIAPATSTRSRKRTIYSKEQTNFLQNQFDLNPYPDFVNRCRIAKITGIPEPRIQVWFQNRRARHLPRATTFHSPQGRKSPTSEGPRSFLSREAHYPDEWGQAPNPSNTQPYPN
ncbi:hypothetical protein XELAEV_18019203mg [Xenopus laevis]|uniref:Homeobox protein siamois n=2 Tax=Xenopus laevis TaxID=8355 RepID=A0A974HU63_XENLA|nr:hypothetical protein XELAEV_18019203mg [Xenopus laevis]BAV57538.1 siamois homeodomain 1.L [Xenopus laevis]